MSNNISGTGFISGSGIIEVYNIPIDEPTNLSVINNKGRSATIKYFNLTPPPRCVPRFGKVTAIRDYE